MCVLDNPDDLDVLDYLDDLDVLDYLDDLDNLDLSEGKGGGAIQLVK